MQFIQCNDHECTRLNMDDVTLFCPYGTLAIKIKADGKSEVLSYESTELRDKDIAEMDMYLLMHTE